VARKHLAEQSDDDRRDGNDADRKAKATPEVPLFGVLELVVWAHRSGTKKVERGTTGNVCSSSNLASESSLLLELRFIVAS
jgi:hypothetical protein